MLESRPENETKKSKRLFLFIFSFKLCLLLVETDGKIQTMEMRSFRRLLGISYREHITNEEVRSRIRQPIGPYKDLRALPRHFSRALCKVGEEGADRENDGKITSVSGQAWD